MKVISFNCHGIKSCLVELYNLCNSSDIVFLQETLLFSDELCMLSQIHPDFEGYGLSAINLTKDIFRGRPFGGVAILVRKIIRPLASFKYHDDPRLLGLELCSNSSNERYLLLNVYLPYQCDDNFDEFMEYMGKISDIIEESPCTHICILGDFNAGPGTLFESELLELCNNHSLNISDYNILGRYSGTFT